MAPLNEILKRQHVSSLHFLFGFFFIPLYLFFSLFVVSFSVSLFKLFRCTLYCFFVLIKDEFIYLF